jgi:hypothetical protein
VPSMCDYVLWGRVASSRPVGLGDGWTCTGHRDGQAIPKAGGFEAATRANCVYPHETQSHTLPPRSEDFPLTSGHRWDSKEGLCRRREGGNVEM